MAGLVYIVDDDRILRNSLFRLLSDAGFKVKAFASAEDFLKTESRCEPSCILLDVKMDGISGFEMQKQLMEREFAPPIVFLSGSANLENAVSAMRAGACHFLLKPVGEKQLIEALAEAIESSSSDASFYGFLQNLTKTEKKIAKLIRQGFQTKQISAELGTSVRTIEWHRKNIGRKGYLPK